MNMIQAKAIQQQQQIEASQHSQDSPSQQHPSPVRQSSIFGALTKPKVSHEILTHIGGSVLNENRNSQSGFGKSNKFKTKIPKSIEDVPFRRQDRRILNARRKRMIDRSLIRFVLSCGSVLILTGSTLILLWFFLKVKWTDPFLIIGPVISGCGVLILLFSVEICVRLYKNTKKVLDPEIDNLKNLHLIKHWVNPELIPYGWGQYASNHSCDFSEDETLHYDHPTSSSNSNHSPHGTMTIEMKELGAGSKSPEISQDIFDESLRYSSVNRPRLHIERTESPPGGRPQIRGDFVTEEDRIANLFSSKKKGRTK